MVPIFHPPLESITVEGILHALADPVRAEIFSKLVSSTCAQNCSTFLHVDEKAIPKSTLSQHFKALREAGLIHSERHGTEMRNTPRCSEIEARFPNLVSAIVAAHRLQSERTRVTAKRARRTPVATRALRKPT